MTGLRLLMIPFCVLTAVEPAAANDAHARLMAMPESDQTRMLSALVRSADDACDRGTRSMYQGSTPSGIAIWSVACRDGNAYSITINPDRVGSTKVLSCKVLKALKAGECFTRYSK